MSLRRTAAFGHKMGLRGLRASKNSTLLLHKWYGIRLSKLMRGHILHEAWPRSTVEVSRCNPSIMIEPSTPSGILPLITYGARGLFRRGECSRCKAKILTCGPEATYACRLGNASCRSGRVSSQRSQRDCGQEEDDDTLPRSSVQSLRGQPSMQGRQGV